MINFPVSAGKPRKAGWSGPVYRGPGMKKFRFAAKISTGTLSKPALTRPHGAPGPKDRSFAGNSFNFFPVRYSRRKLPVSFPGLRTGFIPREIEGRHMSDSNINPDWCAGLRYRFSWEAAGLPDNRYTSLHRHKLDTKQRAQLINIGLVANCFQWGNNPRLI
jgi:hypothetical protein